MTAASKHIKGIDDALVAGAKITVIPFPAQRLKIRSGDIGATAPPPALPTPLRSIGEARAMLACQVRQALERPGTEPGRHIQVMAGVGIGKTHVAAGLMGDWE